MLKQKRKQRKQKLNSDKIKLPNSEQSYKGKVKTHNYINRQNQPTIGELMHFHIVKMYKDKEVKKSQGYFFSQCVT
jgi:hypothetical protein